MLDMSIIIIELKVGLKFALRESKDGCSLTTTKNKNKNANNKNINKVIAIIVYSTKQ